MEDQIKKYKDIAAAARRKVIEMLYKAQTSHAGSNLSVIDILTVLYEKANINKEDWENRDRIILSKGWAAATLYYCLWRKGLLTDEEINSYCLGDSRFIGLAEPVKPGIEFAGGSMGHGLPAAVGMALAAKRSNKTWRIYCVMSDGEMDCGTTWESALIARQHELGNLIVFVDKNSWQAMGRTEDILNLESLTDKWKSFGWFVEEVDGHNYGEIEEAMMPQMLLDLGHVDKPLVVICNTIKGKGVSFFEDKLEWHYKNINKAEYEAALKELE